MPCSKATVLRPWPPKIMIFSLLDSGQRETSQGVKLPISWLDVRVFPDAPFLYLKTIT
ncbi:hypothetical protein PHAMO_30158 [Magnetospirillum molischianum DSM 120]|uniref:Uncharacterized protein n=1 Tax=Magnetospirillum molischianum DSM 120 TaxID=1150626 RepID=H8FUG4_MAGML|nr:hypothetical protein PHAMO_30158 [Magnetospirillum molischianum DSM 120]